MNKRIFRNIFLIWLAWVLIIIGFQTFATARIQPQFPDRAQWWTEQNTLPKGKYQQGHPYLLEPTMNNQVAWDSEYYIAIAVGGYDNPCSPTINLDAGNVSVPCTDPNPPPVKENPQKPISLSYAFFPFYPIMMRIFAVPLGLILNPIAAAAVAGVIVSALGTLAAMLALYDLCYDALGEDGGMRAVFYLLIFPTGFFLAQVYTEGLFVGLAFSCLVMIKRKRLVLAALLAAAATMTRAVGISLVIPMVIAWLGTNEWYSLDLEWSQLLYHRPPLRTVWHALLAFAPAIVFVIWRASYNGSAFNFVETAFFGRATLDIGASFAGWSQSFVEMLAGIFNGKLPRDLQPYVNPQHSAYYFTEFLGLGVGLIAILRCRKTHPEVAWFSLAVFLISWASGPAMGIHRYVLGAPAVFISLAGWGKNPVFDRAWTLISLLLMGLLATLYAFNFWVA